MAAPRPNTVAFYTAILGSAYVVLEPRFFGSWVRSTWQATSRNSAEILNGRIGRRTLRRESSPNRRDPVFSACDRGTLSVLTKPRERQTFGGWGCVGAAK